MKTILMPVLGADSDETALEMAGRVVQVFGAHIDGLHVRRNTIEEVASKNLGDSILRQDVWDAIEQSNILRAERAAKTFRSFCRKADIPIAEHPPNLPSSAAWDCIVGDFAREIAERGTAYELIVIGRELSPQAFTTGDLGDILVRSGRPVLVVPIAVPAEISDTVAIAWNDTPESAHALTAAMPVISKAKRVMVLSVDEGNNQQTRAAARLAEQLAWYGCKVEVRTAACEHRSVTNALLDEAKAIKADLLVMGAYGRSRALEFVLGGVTRDLLDACPIPLLITH